MIGRTALELGPCLARGGEARIFALRTDQKTVAKLYHQPTPEQADKLAVMITHPPADILVNGHTVIAWPTRRLFSQTGSGRIAGYLMPRVADGVPAAHLHNMKSRLASHPHFNWKYIVRAAMNTALAVQRVHDAGYVIGDVNDQGILVAPNAIVALVDCDSFQVTDPITRRIYRSKVGVGAFTPPELAGCNFGDVDRTANHDRFGLAVMIYQFLMGSHPFQVRVSESTEAVAIEDCIVRGFYADVVDAADRSPVSLPLDVLPPRTRTLFRASFTGDPLLRPTAEAWSRELWVLDRELVSCGRNANHFFPRHRSACPWCERADFLGGRDPFPSDEAIRNGAHLRRTTRVFWAKPKPRQDRGGVERRRTG